MTDITISSASFDALADYDVYSKDNISSIHWLQDHFYLSDDLGFDILSSPNLSRWLLSVDSGAIDFRKALETDPDKWTNNPWFNPYDRMLNIRSTVDLTNVKKLYGSNNFTQMCIGQNVQLSMPSLTAVGGTNSGGDFCIYDGEDNYKSAFDWVIFYNSKGFNHLQEIDDAGFHKTEFYDSAIFQNVVNIRQFGCVECYFGCGVLDLPKCQSIDYAGFAGADFSGSTTSINAPNLTALRGDTFINYYNDSNIKSGVANISSFNAPNLTHMGMYALAGTSVNSFNFLNSLKHIDGNAFSKINGLQLQSAILDLTLPNLTSFDCSVIPKDDYYTVTFRLPSLSVVSGSFDGQSSGIRLLDFTGNSNFSFKDDATFRSTYRVSDQTEIIYDDPPVELIMNGDKYVNTKTLTGDVSFTINWSTMQITGFTQIGKQRTIDGEQLENKEITTIKGYSKCKCSTIGSFALTDCNQLTSVDIRSPLTIQDNACASANLLQTVIVPRVKSIGQNAFANCPWLNTLDIHESKYSSLSSDDNYVGDMIEYWGISTSQSSLVIECYDGQYSPKA